MTNIVKIAAEANDKLSSDTVSINNMRYIIPHLDFQTYLNKDKIWDHKTQRAYKTRLRKMSPIFAKRTAPQDTVHIIEMTRDVRGKYQGEPVDVYAGYHLADGHTRREWWIKQQNNFEELPETITAFVYKVDSWKEYKAIYDSFDAQESTEKKNEKITGAINALGLDIKTPRAKGGNFASALDIAYPGDNKDDVLTKVAYFKDEIATLDETGIFAPKDKSLAFQCLFAIGLAALKVYSTPPTQLTRIIGGLRDLATKQSDRMNWNEDKWYGVDAIIREYTSYDVARTIIPEGYHKKTSFSSIQPQMDFMWYVIETYMMKQSISKSGGFKKNHVDGSWDKALSKMINIQAPQGYEVVDTDDADAEE